MRRASSYLGVLFGLALLLIAGARPAARPAQAAGRATPAPAPTSLADFSTRRVDPGAKAQAVPATPPPDSPCATTVYTGALTLTDPQQAGRLNRNNDTSVCGAPKACPGPFGATPRAYDAYTFVNDSGAAVCATIALNSACADTQYIFSAAYLGSFDPNDLCANYLGDSGVSPNPAGQYAVDVPDGATLVVVVHEVNSGAGCPLYTLSVSCVSPSQASPTPVAPTPTATPAVSPTPAGVPCPAFGDVHDSDYFYQAVSYLVSMRVISGYGDCTYRPYNATTRGQMVKIVAGGFALPVYTPPVYTFADVPPGNPFYTFIETTARAGIVSGYSCGALPGEPCDSLNRPYFRPGAPVTRGQLAKIVAGAAGWASLIPASPSFADVSATGPFYPFIEAAYCHGVINGYVCGGLGEPCDSGNRPYFRQFSNSNRGQIAKIVYGALTSVSACPTPPAAP
jgi:hypothetical protein